jgi:glycosyltransferase involved in cell wall biosynthesis
MATLSVCMLTMNDVECIGTALESIKGLGDEIIAVDEYSTDGTRELLVQYGAKVVDGKLNNDYSALRNIAISQSKMEWIFFIDSDEMLEPVLKDALKTRILMAFCEKKGYDAVALKRKNYIDGVMLNKIVCMEAGNIQIYPDWQFRLFRNNKVIKYILPVHETLSRYERPYYSQEEYHILHMKSGARQERQNKKYAALYEQTKAPKPQVEGI